MHIDYSNDITFVCTDKCVSMAVQFACVLRSFKFIQSSDVF